jgi:hypothetical protein
MEFLLEILSPKLSKTRFFDDHSSFFKPLPPFIGTYRSLLDSMISFNSYVGG